MHDRDIIVVGASFGGMKALKQLFGALPADFPAAVFVVWHTAANAPGLLAETLNKSGPLPAAFARDGEPIRHGRVYVAPPDQHLLLTQDSVCISRGAKENRFRPAIDPLFRSAAGVFGPRVIGVLLTGLLDDGTQGLWFIKRRGGVCVAQDPHEAEASSMPQSAIDEGVVDHVVSVSAMPALLSQLLHQPVQEPAAASGDISMPSTNDTDLAHLHPPVVPGPQVPLACPDCHGSLWVSGDGNGPSAPTRYECHVGHQYTEQALAAAKRDELELAVWTALRVLKENAALMGTMAERARAGGRNEAAAQYEQTRQEYHEKAKVIRRAIDTTAA